METGFTSLDKVLVVLKNSKNEYVLNTTKVIVVKNRCGYVETVELVWDKKISRCIVL